MRVLKLLGILVFGQELGLFKRETFSLCLRPKASSFKSVALKASALK